MALLSIFVVVVFAIINHYSGLTPALLWMIIGMGLIVLKGLYGPAPKS